MQITVRGQSTHTLECVETGTIGDLKALIAGVSGIAVGEQLLYSCGQPLDDETAVLNAAIESGTVDLTVGVKGGKVHGSLARAGKVKGQTPKVEKQEKRKQKTGRAKRRAQYNRRFITVVPTFGKRRGPNSHAP